MASLVPVDRKRHSGKGWRPVAGYAFAATQALAPLTASEFPRASVGMPIAFIEHSGRYTPVAVMSPVQGRNLFVGPSGQWLGSYVPAALRSYPFHLGRVEGADTILVDEDSGWVVDAGKDAARFFEDDDSPSAALKVIIELLQQMGQDRLRTESIVAMLAEAHLFQSWPMTVNLGEQQVNANGLYHVNESMFTALEADLFLKFRHAMGFVYSHLVSSYNVGLFTSLAMFQQQMAQQSRPLTQSLTLFPDDDDGLIKFN